MSSNEEIVNFLKRQVEIENKIVELANTSLREIRNLAVKGVLKGISLDSVKHADMYKAAIELLTGTPPALTQEHLDRQTDLLKEHISLEKKAIEKIEEAMPSIESEEVRLLLNSILADERRHHELLNKILKVLVRGETITEADWWDVLWREVPYHGAPGG